MSENSPASGIVRDIIKILDQAPVVDPFQLRVWSWIADYYMCNLGEVLRAALPSAMLLEGEKSSPVVEKYKPKTETFIILALASQTANCTLSLINWQRRKNNIMSWLHISGKADIRKEQI